MELRSHSYGKEDWCLSLGGHHRHTERKIRLAQDIDDESQLAQDNAQRRVKNLRAPQKVGNSLTRKTTISFSGSTLLYQQMKPEHNRNEESLL